MRTLVITKRYTSGKDLLKDRFGRIYELSQHLAARGHTVHGIAVGYRNESELKESGIDSSISTCTWQSVALNWTQPWRAVGILSEKVRDFSPSVIWAGGDALQVILGYMVAKRAGIPIAVDLYDNYEAFWITWMPGILQYFRRAVRGSNVVTCVSDALANLVHNQYGYTGSIYVIENGVGQDIGGPVSRLAARRSLSLDLNEIVIGTAGSLRERRGISTLFSAFQQVRSMYPHSTLLLAGPTDRYTPDLSAPGIRYLGVLPHSTMRHFYKALDVAIICNRNTPFGRYCYPLKLPEILRAGIPLVGARVGPMADLLSFNPEVLYEPDDSTSLATAIVAQIQTPTPPQLKPNEWATLARHLEHALKRAVNTGISDP